MFDVTGLIKLIGKNRKPLGMKLRIEQTPATESSLDFGRLMETQDVYEWPELWQLCQPKVLRPKNLRRSISFDKGGSAQSSSCLDSSAKSCITSCFIPSTLPQDKYEHDRGHDANSLKIIAALLKGSNAICTVKEPISLDCQVCQYKETSAFPISFHPRQGDANNTKVRELP